MIDTKKLIQILKKQYPNPKTELKYSNSWELLVAVILSAQCTDKRVNIVTEKLFKKYGTIKDYAGANLEEFEQDIKSTGFYRNKAKNIIKSANIILNNFKGKIPNNMKDMLTLAGVARKTANIILYEVHNKTEGIAVDTHVKRLSYRFGLTKNTNPDKIEQDLMKIFPKKEWGKINGYFVLHGRYVCTARKPKCEECMLNKICPSAIK